VLYGCTACSNATTCTACFNKKWLVDPITNSCKCNSTGYEHMTTNAQGFCRCDVGYHLKEDFGCAKCQYLIPGCSSCSEVLWDSGIKLDTTRMYGLNKTNNYVTCNSCVVNERFVQINLDAKTIPNAVSLDYSNLPATVKTESPVKCENCAVRFDGCSSCGIFGEDCKQCYSTHVLEDNPKTAGKH